MSPVRLPRRRRPPDAVRALRVPDGDRRLAWAVTSDGEPVVSTVLGLLMPGRELVAWAEVERATWLRPLLTVVELAPGAAPVSGTGRETVLRLDDEGSLPDQVRSAVTTSVAWSTHVRLQPAAGARIVARRRPGRDELEWQVVYDPGTDVSDPALRAQAQAVRDRSQRSLG